MEDRIEEVKSWLKGKCSYSFDSTNKIIKFAIEGCPAIGKVYISINFRKTDYLVYTFFNNHADSSNINQVAEFLHRANRGMCNGNFEINYDTGKICYKVYVNFDHLSKLSNEIIEDSVLIGYYMFLRYGKGLLEVMFGKKSPVEGVADSENKNLDEIQEITTTRDDV